MRHKFKFNTLSIKQAAVMFMIGWLLILTPLIMDGRYKELLVCVSGLIILHIFLWLCLAYGSYVLIDQQTGFIQSSYFFFSKKVPLSKIIALKGGKLFAGMLTELRIEYIDKTGKTKNANLMGKEYFSKDEFKTFLRLLQEIEPNIHISSNLLT